MNKNYLNSTQTETDSEQLRIQKMKFGIISNFRSQLSKRNLWLFTLDNHN